MRLQSLCPKRHVHNLFVLGSWSRNDGDTHFHGTSSFNSRNFNSHKTQVIGHGRLGRQVRDMSLYGDPRRHSPGYTGGWGGHGNAGAGRLARGDVCDSALPGALGLGVG